MGGKLLRVLIELSLDILTITSFSAILSAFQRGSSEKEFLFGMMIEFWLHLLETGEIIPGKTFFT